MPLDSETYAAALKKAKAYTDSMIHRGILVGQVTNGGSFPTTRPDGSALQDEDYCTPLASSTFPFTIGTVTFDNRFTQAVYFSGTWLSNPGAIQDTSETPLKNPSAEGITGLEQTQAQLNISVKNNKVDKSTDMVNTLVYARIAGAETTMEAATGAAIDTLALRTSDGRIKAVDPVAGEDVATKSYVDTVAKPDNVTLDRNGSGELEVKDAGIVTAKLATDSVETLKIKDANVTTAKLADASVTAVKIATDAVETAKIKDDNVTIAKIADANICEVIPFSGAGNSKLTTEKAVVDYVSNGGVNTYTYDNTNEQFELEYVTPDGTSTTKTITAASITKGVVTQTAAQTLTNKTIDVDSNTVSNIEVDNLKAGVLDTTAFSIADDMHIPSSKLVDAKIKDAVSAIIKFVGYVAPTAPAGTGIKVGSYWYQSASEDMPTTFPISVKTYDGTAWSSTYTTYTPAEWEAWINKNTNKEYYYSGGTWNQIDFTIAADNLTINKNVSGELQIKDHGITPVKFEMKTAADSGKGYLIDSTGNTIIDQIKQYKRVTALSTETGNSYTMYVLENPEATYAAGIYVWDAVNGFVNYNGGGSTGPQFIGLVTNGDTFPIIRPDGTALQLGDYVKPSGSSTFPFTIDSCTFTSPRDQATYLGYMNWQLNASPYQSTIDVSVNDATTESLSGTSLFQNNINTENVTAIKERVKALDIPVRENTRAYALNARVLYPEKYGYVCVAITAGTTAASKPAWPTGGIISGVTTFNDGSVQWKVYDAIEGGVKKEDIALRENSTAYAVNARVMYPGKPSFCLICTTAGTSAGSLPAWPATISSGSTTMTDGTAAWRIYDMSLGGVPQLSTFPTADANSPISFQYIGSDGVHEQFAFFKKETNTVYKFTSTSYEGYLNFLPPNTGAYYTVYLDPDLTYPSSFVVRQLVGVYYLTAAGGYSSDEPATYTTSSVSKYVQMFREVTKTAVIVGTNTEPGLVSAATLADLIPNIPVRENGKVYATGSRVLYPGKAGYVLTATTGGTTDSSLPSWPTDVETGTELYDGTITWNITDVATCLPQLKVFPTPSVTSPVAFQYIGTQAGYEQYAIYSKLQIGYRAVSATHTGYVTHLPTPAADSDLYADPDCTVLSISFALQDWGTADYRIYNYSTGVDEPAVVSQNIFYKKGWPRQITQNEFNTGTDTTGKLVSAKFLADNIPNVGMRKNSTYYPMNSRVLYPNKPGYILVCTTDGTSNTTVPSWPATIQSGTTTLTDGIAVWTIYDASLGGVPQLSVFPVYSASSPESFQYIGSQAGYEKSGIYKKGALSCYSATSASYSGYIKRLPVSESVEMYSDPECTLQIPALYCEDDTATSYIIFNAASTYSEAASVSGVNGYVPLYKTITANEISVGTATESSLVTAKAIHDSFQDLLDVGMRTNDTLYVLKSRALFPSKPGYVLVCTTAGTSASSAPLWPYTIVSGSTTLTDGTAVWTIYDATQDVKQEGDIAATLRSRQWVWAKRGPTNTVKFVSSVKFSSGESPTGLSTQVFSLMLQHSTSDGWGNMTAYLGGIMWTCSCSGASTFSAWKKVVVNSDLQTFYDGIFPVGFISYGPTAPGVPTGITATWTEDTSDNARFLQVSSEAAGTQKGEQLPNIKGKFGVVSYSTGSPIVDYMDGAFSRNMLGNTASGLSFAGDLRGLAGVYFNAANSSGVYADGGAVRPLTTTIKKWKRTA